MAKQNVKRDHLKTPFRAYKGNDPYIFVSYAHVDAMRVFPELIRFYNQGYNIWYDQGISPGSEWPEEIEDALSKSSLFIVFISKHAVESRNVRNEINFALAEKKPFIAIYLEDTELKYGLKLSMGSIQGILKHSMSEEEYVFKYTNAFKREGIKPSKKPETEIIADTNESLAPDNPDRYVFVGYDKKDEKLVLPELKKLQMQGLNIKAINFENEWSEDTEKKILDSSLVLMYLTSNTNNSLIVRDEISLAHLEDIPFIAIYLEEVELKYGLKLILSSKESIRKYDMDEEEYVQRYTHSLMRYGFTLTEPDILKTTDEKYIYASFDIKDKEEAISQIEDFADLGLNIEYDLSGEGNEENLTKLLNSSLFLVFITPNSIRSNIVRDEIYLALSEDIPFVAIYLSETKITSGLKSQLDSKLIISKYMLDDEEYVKRYIDAFKQHGFEVIEKSKSTTQSKEIDERLNNEYLKEFDKLNTSTKSIFELDGNNVLIILKDGTNITDWSDVKNIEDIMYVSEDLSNHSDLSRKYKGLKSLKAIVTSEISSEVTNMDLMFNSCDSLVEISCLEHWDTSNVTSMKSMFAGCSSLEDFSPLKGWNTSKVTNFANLFANCKSLTDISFLKDWNVSKITNMKSTFRGCRSIKNLSGLENWNTSKAKDMSNMFDGCRALVDSSGFNKWNTSKVTTMQSMFRFCDSMKDLSGLAQWDTSNVRQMNGMFKNCRSIVDITDLNGWDTTNLQTKEGIFEGCEALKEYPKWYKNLNDERLTSEFLKEFEKLNTTTESIFELDGNNVLIILKDGTNITSWFDVKNKEDIIYVSEDLSSVDDLNGKYQGLKSLKAIVTSNISNKVTEMKSMFGDCFSLVDISSLQLWNTSNVTDMRWTFSGCSSLSDFSSIKNWKTTNVTNMMGMFKGCSSLSDVSFLENWDTSNVTKMVEMFCDCSSLSNISGLLLWNTSNVTSMREMFGGCSSLTDISGLNDWKTINVSSMREMFSGCSSLTDVSGLKEWNTTNVKYMDSMFSKCISLNDISGLQKWSTANVTSMKSMFVRCYSLVDLSPLSDWDTSNADKKSIFAYCKSIKTYPLWDERNKSTTAKKSRVKTNHTKPKKDKTDDERLTSKYLKEFEKLNTTTESIFELGKHKVLIILKDGTNITDWNDVKNNRDVIYVSEDLSGCTDLIGKYKGLKFLKAIVTSNVTNKITNMSGMFNGCSSLNEISTLEKWNMSNVTDMKSMFRGCSSLNDISSLKNWNTKNVKTMKGMFRGCSSLVDISSLQNWNTLNVEVMTSMFHNCSSLNDVSSLQKWDASNVIYMASMFSGCSSLIDMSPLSDWNVSDANKENIFANCTSIKTYPQWYEETKSKTKTNKITDDKSVVHVKTPSELSDSIRQGIKIIIDSDMRFDTEIKLDVDNLIIEGNGHAFDGRGRCRFFTITGKNITINSLTFKNGFNQRNYEPGPIRRYRDTIWRGGAIYNEGNCTFNECKFINNVAGKDISHLPSVATAYATWYAHGGAIYNEGNCTLIDCIFEGNEVYGERVSQKNIAPHYGYRLINCKLNGKIHNCDIQNKSTEYEMEKTKDTKNLNDLPAKKEQKSKTDDKRLTSKYLKEFEKLNTTTESIFELGKHKVLIILKDRTNITDWNDVINKEDIIYISEDISTHTNLSGKYRGFKSLKAIVTTDLPDKITSLKEMFAECSSLKDISCLKNWNTAQVTDMNSMFAGCTSLTDLSSLQNWQTQNVTDMALMFEDCSSIVDLFPLSNWNTSKANKTNMFKNCSSIKRFPFWKHENLSSQIDIANDSDTFKKLIAQGVKNIELGSDFGMGGVKISSDDITIDGKGHTISGIGSNGIFEITGSNITFKNTTFARGLSGGNGREEEKNRQRTSREQDINFVYYGGAIYVPYSGDCTFINCNFNNNVAGNADRAKIQRVNVWYNAKGGAIYANGFCKLISCTFNNNKSIEGSYNDYYGCTVENPANELSSERNQKSKKDKTEYKRLTSKSLKEFEKLNTTTESIFELGKHDVLIILKDGTNLTKWDDVENKGDIIYISEDLSFHTDLSGRYSGLTSLKAIVTTDFPDKITSLKEMFAKCVSLTDVSCLQNWNTSNITNMNAMFYRCTQLTEIAGLSNWNTENVADMKSMFEGCSALTDISGLQNWNTENVADISFMFMGCHALTDISRLQNWNTSNVTKMNGTFEGCSALTDITGLSNWNSENITHMISMFSECSALTDIVGLSKWNTENITHMNSLFYGCSALIDVNGLANWNTQNLTHISYMFMGCSALTDITGLSNWNTQNIKDMSYMFKDCSSLVDVSPLSNWEVSEAYNTGIFKDCVNIKKYPLWDERSRTTKTNDASFNSSNENKSKMHDERLTTESLKEFEKLNTTTNSIFELGEYKVLIILKDGTNLTGWSDVNVKEDILFISEDLSNQSSLEEKYDGLISLKAIVTTEISSQVTNMEKMFNGCSSLMNINSLENWDTQNVTNMEKMFNGCSSLTDVSGLQNWDTQNVADMKDMFNGCSSLTDVSGLQNWDTQNVADMNGMFSGCSSLTDVSGLQNWDTQNVTDMRYMFWSCSSLADVSSLQNWNTKNVTYMSRMFKNCSSLVDLTPLSNWDTSNATKTDIFKDCENIKKYPSWDDKNSSEKSGFGSKLLKSFGFKR